MNYEDANQVLNNVKYGLFEPAYKINQALLITGDLVENRFINEKLNRYGTLDNSDREKITVTYVTRPSYESY